MDPELQQLLDRIGTDEPPSNEELAQLREQLVEQLQEAVEGDDPDIETGREIRQAIDNIDEEVDRREEASRQQREEAQALLEGIDDDEEGDGEEDETSEEEPVASDASEDDDEQSESEEEGERQPVPASASTGQSRGNSGGGSVPARRSRRRSTVQRVTEAAPVDVLLAGPALGAGEPRDLADAAEIFHRYAHQVNRGRQTLVELRYNYPQERSLTASATENTRMLDNYLSPRALAAAGGVCEPVPADFTHPICGDRGRAIRDALPQFGADRGGVRFSPSATLNDLQTLGGGNDTSAVNVHTHTDDQNGNTKPCPAVECETEVEEFVDAIVACLQVGNFQARFNPEFWQSRLDLLMVLHDRVAEQHLFSEMQASATSVDAVANEDGTARTLLLTLDKAAAGIRSRHRLSNTALRWVAPSWLRDAIRASLARQQPGDGLDAFNVADQQIAEFFNRRNINPVWSPDLQVFPDQTAATALEDWPSDQATGLLFPEGTFFHMDGGMLDLGTEITDSTLNSTNDRQAFMETFEQVAMRGCEALELTVPVGEDCVCSTAS